MPSARRCSVLLALALITATGCGAKTGLYVDDTGNNGPIDTGIRDAGVDAPMRDASFDGPCIEVPFDGGPVDLALTVEAEVGRADVVFLIDRTASMGEEIDRIREQLRDQLAPSIRSAIPDSQLGVATFADFPVEPYGSPREDTPFELRLPMTNELSRVQAAVNAIELNDGRDIPESQVEALYQLMTGEGFPAYGVPPSAGCPMGGSGYACFRRDALPVVLLFTDAEFHNGPGGDNPYMARAITPPPHTYGQALTALTARGAVVIGFDSGDGAPREHLEAVAEDTGATSDGEALVYDIGGLGQRLGTSVVSAIETFAGTVVQDIDAIISDPDPRDGVDVLAFIEGVFPVSADPMSGVASIDRDGRAFRGARAGTSLSWQLVLRNDAFVPGPEPQRFQVEVIFRGIRGDSTRRLQSIIVTIVVPGADGAGCEEF